MEDQQATALTENKQATIYSSSFDSYTWDETWTWTYSYMNGGPNNNYSSPHLKTDT